MQLTLIKFYLTAYYNNSNCRTDYIPLTMSLGFRKITNLRHKHKLASDLLKVAGEDTLKELTRIINKLSDGDNIPDDWKNSITLPIFKGKGNAMKCGNYSEVRLQEHSEQNTFILSHQTHNQVVTNKTNKLGKISL